MSVECIIFNHISNQSIYVDAADDSDAAGKLLETDFPVIVLDNKSRHDVNYLNCFSLSNLIIENDRLVHYLLELGVFQVISYHHLQNLEQLAIWNEPVIVHVVDPWQ